MLGKLTLSAIPSDQPIVMTTLLVMLIFGLAILALITYHKKWPYLWKEWFTSLDHKKIGIMYIVLAFIMLLRGFADAVMMRLQQSIAVGDATGFLSADHFSQIFSAHGSIMVIFMAMPFMAGLMNIAVPQQIGARDVAFPLMNSVSLMLTAAATGLVMISLALGEFSHAGWAGYAPLTEKAFSPGTGVDYWMWSFQIAGAGSLLTGINFFVTILKMRAPGMTLMRMPVFTWTVLVSSILIILAFPVLTVALALLALDRYADMHFYTSGMGGNIMMYVNLFWVWGHPEVYILILPAFGVFSEVVATFSSKRIFGYKSLVYATAAIGVLSFTVWLHHFYTMGAGGNVNAFFGIATILISIPTGVKIFNWLFTMYRGRVRFTSTMYWTLGFLTTFTIGGMTGVLLAIPPADFVLHNSLFLIGHFHNVLIPGVLFGFVAGYTYWFPKAFGFPLNEVWGKRAFWGWQIGFFVAFMPLYVLGFMGMPRRMDHYANPAWQPYLIVAAIGTAIILLGVIFQMIQLYVSIRDRHKTRDLTGDIWGGRTLEWASSSPPPVYNFAVIPEVHDLDAFTDMKEKGIAYKQPEKYHDIVMPKDAPHGVIIGAFSFLLGFGLVWYIWWLAIVSLLGLIATVVMRAQEEETEYVIPAEEVKAIEDERYRLLQSTGHLQVSSNAKSSQVLVEATP